MTVAIDWGNTNTVVAFRKGDQDHVLRIRGQELIPSCMQYDDDGHLLSIGREAKNSLRLGHGRVIAGIKRLIGVKYDEFARRWAEGVYGLRLHSENGAIRVQIGNALRSPESMATEYFQQLGELLREESKHSVGFPGKLFGKSDFRNCLATCPAHYHDSQKRALRDCLVEAGYELSEGGLLPEPAVVSKLTDLGSAENAFVVDWGGGTLDFALVTAGGDCEYLSAIQRGCGGIDMDIAIIHGLQSEGRFPSDLSQMDLVVLRDYIEGFKERVLSSGTDSSIRESISLPDRDESVSVEFTLQEVLGWIKGIVDRAATGIGEVLAEVSEKWALKLCMLIGGPVTSPHIFQEVRGMIPGRIPVNVFENPMTAIARGALRCLVAGSPMRPSGHDYGVAANLINHEMGVLLLRSRQALPFSTPQRRIEFGGHAGKRVEISVWARKADPSEARFHYEKSSSYTFLPQFDDNGNAAINVSLIADAAGIVTARVVDATSNQQMILTQVGSHISEQMSGPPCRSMSEAAGLLLLACWRSFVLRHSPLYPDATVTAAHDRSEIDGFIQNWLRSDTGNTVSGDIRSLARQSERFAQMRWEELPPKIAKALEEVSRTCSKPGENWSTPVKSAAIESLDSLYVEMIRAHGEQEITSQLRVYSSDPEDNELHRKAKELESLFRGFSKTKYERLVALWGEVASKVAVDNGPAAELRKSWSFVDGILNLHASLREIETRS